MYLMERKAEQERTEKESSHGRTDLRKKAKEDLEKVSKKLIQQIKKQKKLKSKRIPQQ